VRARLVVEADPEAAVSGRDDAGDRAIGARTRHLHAVRTVVLGADPGHRRPAVAAQDQPGARRAADGDALEMHALRAVELEPGAVAQQRCPDERSGAAGVEVEARVVLDVGLRPVVARCGAEVAERGVGGREPAAG
jgi:hypothetical protein